MYLTLAGVVVGIFLGVSGVLAILIVLRRRVERVGAGSTDRVEGEVNVLGGLVLPVPEDVRWRGCSRLMKFGGGEHLLITVGVGNRLYVRERRLPHSAQTDRYCKAVVKAARRRMLEELSRKVDDAVANSEVSSPTREGRCDVYGEPLESGQGCPIDVSGGARIALEELRKVRS